MADKQYIKANGVWKEATADYVKVNGVWKMAIAKYVKRNGAWEDATPEPENLYGIVYYRTDNGAGEERKVYLQNATEFASLGFSSSTATATLGAEQIVVKNYNSTATTNVVTGVEIGSQITTLPTRFMSRCMYLERPVNVPSNVTSLGQYFLSYCQNYNLPVTLPNTITTLPDYFMASCSSFNQSITFPSSITSVGNNFMGGCSVFNKAITLSGVASVGDYFMSACLAFNSRVALSSSFTSIGNYFLNACTSYNNTASVATIINRVTTQNATAVTIGNHFMDGCSALDSAGATIYIANSNSSIGTHLFYNCTSLTDFCTFITGSTSGVAPFTASDYSFATDIASASMYSTGIFLNASAYATPAMAAFQSRFPTRNSAPYRKFRTS